jgi:hypothetical protein
MKIELRAGKLDISENEEINTGFILMNFGSENH